MIENQTCVFCWSGGKDSALALYKILSGKQDYPQVAYLLTTLSAHYDRVSMHGVRRTLMHTQARNINIPIKEIFLPENATMEQYDEIMHDTWHQLLQENINLAVFGDIFLENLRQYREAQLEKAGSKAMFPLWQQDTTDLAREFIDLGFKSIIVSIDASRLDESFVGRVFDDQFLKDLPDDVDPCGENGEFHSFVFDGPIFSSPVEFSHGEKVYKTYQLDSNDKNSEKGYWFMDLIPTANG